MPPEQRRDPPTRPAARFSPEIAELLRSGLECAIPFNVHNAVRIREVAAGHGVAELPELDRLKNHLGTQHGGALFAVAEAAAGAAYLGAFAEHVSRIRMNAQEAHIVYLRWARGPITAHCKLEDDSGEILRALHDHEHTELAMRSELHDTNGTTVAEITFRFRLQTLPPNPGRR
jgi:acyl-coenzyme A thioesterase PaaI-like protein